MTVITQWESNHHRYVIILVYGFAVISRVLYQILPLLLLHALYDKHHKVISFLRIHQNAHNSVKYEDIWKWLFVSLIHKEHWISLACISGHKCVMQTSCTTAPGMLEELWFCTLITWQLLHGRCACTVISGLV